MSCSRRGSDRRTGCLCEMRARSECSDCTCIKHGWVLTGTVALVAEVGRAAVVLAVALERARNALAVVALEEARTATVLDRYKRRRSTSHFDLSVD